MHFELREGCGSSKIGLEWRCLTFMDKLTYRDQTWSLTIQAHMTIPIWRLKRGTILLLLLCFWFCCKGCIEMVKILRTPKLEYQKLLKYGSFTCS
jgi:hypothetical protein